MRPYSEEIQERRWARGKADGAAHFASRKNHVAGATWRIGQTSNQDVFFDHNLLTRNARVRPNRVDLRLFAVTVVLLSILTSATPVGADPNEDLFFAAMKGRLDAAQAAVAAGADVNYAQANYGGVTALWPAVNAGRVEMVRWLIAHGADVNARTASGDTPLHRAAANDQVAIVPILVEAGSQIDAVDDYGYTPLMHAAERDFADTVRALLAAGANPHNRNPDGQTALSIADEAGATNAAEVLRAATAGLDRRIPR